MQDFRHVNAKYIKYMTVIYGYLCRVTHCDAQMFWSSDNNASCDCWSKFFSIIRPYVLFYKVINMYSKAKFICSNCIQLISRAV